MSNFSSQKLLIKFILNRIILQKCQSQSYLTEKTDGYPISFKICNKSCLL